VSVHVISNDTGEDVRGWHTGKDNAGIPGGRELIFIIVGKAQPAFPSSYFAGNSSPGQCQVRNHHVMTRYDTS
jgi:hypothetical protein